MRKITKKVTKKELKRLAKKELNKKDKAWREQVKARDQGICAICESDRFVHVHHIIPREDKRFRHNIDNGIAICAKHHKFSRQISGHGNSFIFVLWILSKRQDQIINLWEEYIKWEMK